MGPISGLRSPVDSNIVDIVEDMLSNAIQLQRSFLQIKINESNADWKKFMMHEFAKGGGKLFKWIAQEQRAFLTVDIGALCPGIYDPNSEATSWSKHWQPTSVSSHLVAASFMQIWECARCDLSLSICPTTNSQLTHD